jgi:hypothetical protein
MLFAVSGFLPEPSAKVLHFFEILYIDDEIVSSLGIISVKSDPKAVAL